MTTVPEWNDEKVCVPVRLVEELRCDWGLEPSACAAIGHACPPCELRLLAEAEREP